MKILKKQIALALAQGSDLVEVRVDFLQDVNVKQLRDAVKGALDKIVLTCRSRTEGGKFRDTEATRINLLHRLIELSPRFIDLELSTLSQNSDLTPKLELHGVDVIVSSHNLRATPPATRLREIYKRASRFPGIIKIVTAARALEDNTRILSLYDEPGNHRLVAFCLGFKGIVSRVVSCLRGAPMAYASLNGFPTAPGQPTIAEIRDILRVAKPVP